MSKARKVFTPLLAWLAWCFLWCLHRTLRRRVVGEMPTAETECLFAFWHGEQQLVLPFCRGLKLTTLTSQSADGQLQTRILAHFGMASVRGSSSRGGAAGLRGLARAARGGRQIALAVDGPRGPKERAKPGIVQLARLTDIAIVPLRAEGRRTWRLRKTWDGFQIPKPFTTITLRVGQPLHIPRDVSRSTIDDWVSQLDAALAETVRKT